MEDKRLKSFWLLWFVLRVCEVKKKYDELYIAQFGEKKKEKDNKYDVFSNRK